MRRALIQAIVIAVLAAIPAVLSAFFHPKRPDCADTLADGEISARVAIREAGRYFWIDARSARDFDERHIPGALLLNEGDWNTLLPPVMQAWPAGTPAIVYCSSRQCRTSRNVARKLREFDVAPVFELKGGWEAWLALQKK